MLCTYALEHSDSLRDGYSHLRALVMAYGDISPQSPLSMSSSLQTTQQSSTSESSSERTASQLNEGDQSLIDQSHPFPDVPLQPEQVRSTPRSWSRPQSHQSRSAPNSRPISGMDTSRNQTPVSIGICHVCELIHTCTCSVNSIICKVIHVDVDLPEYVSMLQCTSSL